MYSAQENVAVHSGLIIMLKSNDFFFQNNFYNFLKQKLSPFTSHKNCVIWGVYPVLLLAFVRQEVLAFLKVAPFFRF